jgi:hypothetical protein
MYEGENGKYLSYSDARKEHWKCDKLFKNFKLLRDHKAGSHFDQDSLQISLRFKI